MDTPTFAPLPVFRDEGVMEASLKQPEQANVFAREAEDVLGRLKQVLSEVLASLGVRRPVELQRLLKLDVTLSWQIFKVAGERNALAAGAAMPPRANIEKFAKAASGNRVSPELLSRLADTYDDFEQIVERHAGDRTSFISLATAASGMSDEWLSTDLQHRRNAFRAMSHVMGIQARTRLAAWIAFTDPQSSTVSYGMLTINGLVNLRMLRELDEVRVHGVRFHFNNESMEQYHIEQQAFSEPCAGSLLQDFSTNPLPQMKIASGEMSGGVRGHWSQTSLVRPQVGNLGTTTLMFADRFRARRLPEQLNHIVWLPCEVLIQDLIVPSGLFDGEPKLNVILGDSDPTDRAPDAIPVLGRYTVERIGRGTGALATSDVPRYSEMVSSVGAQAGIDLSEHEVWRARLEFPIYQSTSRIQWEPNVINVRKSPASAK